MKWMKKAWRKLLRRAIIWAVLKNLKTYGATVHESLNSPRSPREIRRELLDMLVEHLVKEEVIVFEEYQSQTSVDRVFSIKMMGMKW